MSTSYDIICMECGEWTPSWRDPKLKVWIGNSTAFDDFRDGALLEELVVKWRPAFETVGMALKGMWQFTVVGSPLTQVLDFFGRHAGHSVVVFDEYGRSWAEVLAEKAARAP